MDGREWLGRRPVEVMEDGVSSLHEERRYRRDQSSLLHQGGENESGLRVCAGKRFVDRGSLLSYIDRGSLLSYIDRFLCTMCRSFERW